jgi:hypothetical protein
MAIPGKTIDQLDAAVDVDLDGANLLPMQIASGAVKKVTLSQLTGFSRAAGVPIDVTNNQPAAAGVDRRPSELRNPGYLIRHASL